MVSLLKTILVILFAYSTEAQYKLQKDVPPLHDCSCDGFIFKATECKWEDWKQKQCDEESDDYINYRWHCKRINSYRVDRLTGAI